MKKTLLTRIIVSIVLALGATALSAQNHWSYSGSYENDMRIFFELSQGDVTLDLDNYEVAAFIGGKCRGVAQKMSQDISAEQTIYYGRLQLYGSAATETGAAITFKAYDKTAKKEIDITVEPTMTFADNVQYGTISDLKQFKLKQQLKGDVNGDEKITDEDALLILQIVAKKIKNGAAGVDFEAADVNQDGDITPHDAVLVLQSIVGKINL